MPATHVSMRANNILLSRTLSQENVYVDHVIKLTDLIFSVTVTFVTHLGVLSIIFVRLLSNEACETLKKFLFRILRY